MKLPVVEFPVMIPDTIQLPRGDHDKIFKYLLQVDFDVIINGKLFRIPKGIITDFASVPRWLWNIFPPNDPRYIAAALLHDVGYAGELWPRKEIDKLFFAGMTFLAVENWRRNTMTFAVRVAGGLTYRDHTVESIQKVRNALGVYNEYKSPLWDMLPC